MADAPRLSFWARQKTGDPTAGQIVFDLLFGVLFPLVCRRLAAGAVRGRALTNQPVHFVRVQPGRFLRP